MPLSQVTPGRPVAYVGNRRIDPLRLILAVGFEHFLPNPNGFGHVKISSVQSVRVMMRGLVGHVPPRIGIIEHANYAGFVPDVARVVEGKKVAMVVESQVLRIAQAMGIDLEIRPVGVTTENRTSAGCLVGLAILVHDESHDRLPKSKDVRRGRA